MPRPLPQVDACDAMAQLLVSSPYRLSPEAVTGFRRDGVIGPLACDAPELDTLLEELNTASAVDAEGASDGRRNVFDPQLTTKAAARVAHHPSILTPVAQLLGTEDLSFFQARFRVKVPERHDTQPWHQDVGRKHGGLLDDGTPIPSLTVWLSLDGADTESGSVVLLPGTHQSLLGEWRTGFHGLKAMQHSLDTTDARALDTPRDHFQIFHSWAVHRSLTNASSRPRSALILRYMDRRHAQDVSFAHVTCSLSCPCPSP
jgi:ectoine hydroxylase-related dioxygenase (phytanoyl-CoA dioxygenase family)